MLKKILGQPSWRLSNGDVEAFVTETGGHLGPVRFKLGRRTVEPYSVAPWHSEKLDPKTPPIIKVLRGDFFCMPFGGNSTPFNKEKHPIHGEPANARWKLESLEPKSSLHTTLKTRIRKGRVDKHIKLVKGHRAIYCKHVISQMTGPMSFGHHAMLKFPDEPGSGVISTSPFTYGQVFPGLVENPEQRGYSILKGGAEFTSLRSVPTITGETTDLTRYPARRGFEDLVMIVSDPSAGMAWTAVTFPKQRYVWFALKNPNVLRSTIFWISNGGRHYAPWNSRHVNVLGLEEVTSYFHPGLAESVGNNPLSQQGIATSVLLDPDHPLTVNYIMGVAEVPGDFDRVERIEADSNGPSITIYSSGGSKVVASIDTTFLS
jgi:hypothetical protein